MKITLLLEGNDGGLKVARRLTREGPERVLRCVLLGQDLARPDAAADVCVADGDVAGEPAPRRRRRVGESERGTETVAELLELHAAIRLRRPFVDDARLSIDFFSLSPCDAHRD